MEINNAILIEELCFAYPNKKVVFNDMNLEIKNGEKVGVIGPNGAGKTTLFMLVCGVLKSKKGNISLLGEPLVQGGFNPQIGFVFQNPDDQLFNPTVWDDVAFGPMNLNLSEEEIETRVKKALRITHTEEFAERAPHHLSGGEKRMVSIAGVLALEPEIVIYDEPSVNLDMRSRRRLINFLNDSAETMLISSHDLEFILEVCERVLLIDGGEVIADGNPTEIMSDTEIMETHGLEVPHSLQFHENNHHKD